MTDAQVITALFAGIGVLLFMGVLSWFFYQIGRNFKQGANKEAELTLVEETVMDKVLEKLNIDVNKFIAKREVMKQKSFRQVLEEQMIEEIKPKKEKQK